VVETLRVLHASRRNAHAFLEALHCVAPRRRRHAKARGRAHETALLGYDRKCRQTAAVLSIR